MIEKIKRLIGPITSLILFGAAGWVLHNQLKPYHFHEIIGNIESISSAGLWAALTMTVLNYIVMTGYDALALRYIGHQLAYHKIGLASFIGYAFSNNIGLSMLAGASVRYRLYTAWGLSSFEIAQVVAFCTMTLWLGFLFLGGMVFVIEPMALPEVLHFPFGSLQMIGYLMLGVVIVYAVFSLTRKKTFSIKEIELKLPATSLASFQIGLAVLDWIMAGSVLYILMAPLPEFSFFSFMQIYMLAQFSGLISQIPGGMGVFETVMVIFMSSKIPSAQIFAALVVYRVLYYWLPLVAAVFLLGGQEVARHKILSVKLVEIYGRWVSPILPQVLGIASMVGGAILMFSGATPAIEVRLDFLKHILPLPFLEFSHFVGSIAGMGLILLGWGLQRRLDAAWVLAVTLLAVGIAASLFKGFDYEEATLLAVIEAGLLPSRRYFYRKSSLLAEPFNASWIAAILIVVGASIWLGLIAYRHVEYSSRLWWQFTFSGNASRFLRGTVGAVAFLLFFALVRLLRPLAVKHVQCSLEDTQRIASIIENSPVTNAFLALLGDKNFIFSDNNNAFIMYGISGRCWVSMGDPIGPKEEWPELVWRFREFADQYGARAVFYEVGHENLYLYLDMGLSLIKLGEEARVLLPEFSMEGKHWRILRHTQHSLEKQGCRFEVIPKEETASRMKELKEISDAWLVEKNTREKSFSLGSFLPEYISRFPVCAVSMDGKIVAFANMWQGANKEELAMDLMRFHPDAPRGVMDFLFVNMILWGKEQGYKWFDLGMAPLSGLENRNLAPLWNRLGSLVYRYGENFYNFQGLRQYKEKFDPIWQPKYLASPGGIALPQVFTALAALTSGGIKGVLSK